MVTPIDDPAPPARVPDATVESVPDADDGARQDDGSRQFDAPKSSDAPRADDGSRNDDAVRIVDATSASSTNVSSAMTADASPTPAAPETNSDISPRTAADMDEDADPVPAPPRRTFYSFDATALRQRITTIPARGLRSRLVSANPPGTASSTSTSPNVPPARARPASTATATSTATSNSVPATTASASASTTSATSAPDAADMGGLGSGLFECNVCLETASEPVVTLCGHLFCWPCLHAWFESCQTRRVAQTCPVCKAGSGADKTVPIYARGREALDPRRGGHQTSSSSTSSRSAESTTTGGTAPPRPPPQRPDPVVPQSSSGGASFRFGLFPGMFGVSMSFGGNAGGAAGPDAPLGGVDSEHGNQNLSSLMMLIGLFALFNVVFPLLAM
ncbi:hypothetical protein, variant [Allomyces macrogynus ATCC 38327]|uniref:RING-type E3 ubiquitin transferase n=1 Tax=Allomyces macrogynus (strain ATCC 38327) TaxID=578462 RepID=A0A0L0SYU4_ALLM3|nr:hypothetical protein, variant [Allomyces macrogynus ATCC 38327]|eukprot:KNE67682.1 hypothetical protein, variant [Allomyces macrogynus ATCC 38327]